MGSLGNEKVVLDDEEVGVAALSGVCRASMQCSMMPHADVGILTTIIFLYFSLFARKLVLLSFNWTGTTSNFHAMKACS